MGFKVTDNDRELYLKCSTPEEKQAFILSKWYANDFKSLFFELRDSNNRSMAISWLQAITLLDGEKYYELVGEYITNNGGLIEVPHTLGEYSIAIAGEEFPNDREPLYVNMKDIVNYQKTPYIFAKNIIYDFGHNEIVELIFQNGLVKDAMGKTEEQIISEARKRGETDEDEEIVWDAISQERRLRGSFEEKIEKYVLDLANIPDTVLISKDMILGMYNGESDYIEGISAYITSVSLPYGHYEFDREGFEVVCNLNVEEIKALIDETAEHLREVCKENKILPFHNIPLTQELENKLKYYEAALDVISECSRQLEAEEDVER